MKRFWQAPTDHAMSDQDRLAAALRLIRAAGASLEDQRIVTDAGIGYAPGSSASAGMTDVWVTGNWNNLQRYSSDARRWVDIDTGANMPSRLFDALERIGVNGEWSDEHNRCDDCQRLIRTQPDSYSWTAQYVVFDAGDIVCADCLRDNAKSVIADQYVNNVRRAITWLDESALIDLGWRDAMPQSPSAASGMHPGQNDTPEAIVRQTLGDNDESTDYVFLITDKGQFDIHYRLFIREVSDDEAT